MSKYYRINESDFRMWQSNDSIPYVNHIVPEKYKIELRCNLLGEVIITVDDIDAEGESRYIYRQDEWRDAIFEYEMWLNELRKKHGK